jgi:hypothetical protein
MDNEKIFQYATMGGLAGVIVLRLIGGLICLARKRCPRAVPRAGRRAFERLAFLGFWLVVLLLAVTGFAPAIVPQDWLAKWAPVADMHGRLSGWALMAHVCGGGVFIGFLLALTVLWAEDCRFRPAVQGAPLERFCPGQKLSFWLALMVGVVAIVTMMVSMLPIFGPGGIETLREIHRYCGLAFVMLAYLHFPKP